MTQALHRLMSIRLVFGLLPIFLLFGSCSHIPLPSVSLQTDNRSIQRPDGTNIIVSISQNNRFAPWYVWIAPYGELGKHDRIRINECIVTTSYGKVFKPANLQGLVLPFDGRPSYPPNRVSADDVYSDNINYEYRQDNKVTLRLNVTIFYKNGGRSSFSVVKYFSPAVE